jgi:phage shock protein A
MIDLDTRVERLEEHVARLDDDISEIRDTLSGMATKTDVAFAKVELKSHIDAAIGGVLLNALNAVPGKQAALWTGISGLIAAAAVALATFHGAG